MPAPGAGGPHPPGTYREFIDVMSSRSPEELERKLEKLTKAAPCFYPAWRELIPFGETLDEQDEQLARALALEPDARSQGELLVDKARLPRRRGKEREARALLPSLVEDPKSLPGTVADAKRALTFTPPP